MRFSAAAAAAGVRIFFAGSAFGHPDDRFRVVGFPESFVANNRVFVEIFLHL